MVKGIIFTLGAILVIASRFLYGSYDIGLGGNSENTAMGVCALLADIIGTAMVAISLLSYNGII